MILERTIPTPSPDFAVLYAELKTAARGLMDRGADLRPTELVHEAWERLEGHRFAGATHYKAVAAMAMRQILADHARSAQALKRQRPTHVTLGQDGLGTLDVVALHLALERLETLDPRGYDVVCLRYLGGLTAEETADHLGLSRRTVQSVWRITRAWLLDQIRG